MIQATLFDGTNLPDVRSPSTYRYYVQDGRVMSECWETQVHEEVFDSQKLEALKIKNQCRIDQVIEAKQYETKEGKVQLEKLYSLQRAIESKLALLNNKPEQPPTPIKSVPIAELDSAPQPPAWAIAPKPKLPEDAPTVASLFTGGGLFEVGALAAGFRPIWGVELDPRNPDLSDLVADCYEENFENKAVDRRSIQEIANSERFDFKHRVPDVLHISQPCQSFSQASQRSENEADLEMAAAVVKAIETLLPPVVTFENVPKYQESHSWNLIRKALTDQGYKVKEIVCNCANYGVPQNRQRFFAWACKEAPYFPFPDPPHLGCSWYEAIADLIPSLPKGKLAGWQEKRLAEIDLLPQGYYLVERAGARTDRDLLVRPSNEPSWTIKASLGTDGKGHNRNEPINVITPEGDVLKLTARSLARLQSVPDWYKLPSSMRVAATVIGNGVPPLVSQRFLKHLRSTLPQFDLPQPHKHSVSLKVEPNKVKVVENSTGDDVQNTVVDSEPIWLSLETIKRDSGIQPRTKLDFNHIARLETQIEDGANLKPIEVFYDGEIYWLADGWHRWFAHRNQEKEAIACQLHSGGRREALLYAAGSNADNLPALPRSHADKRRAVLLLLEDKEWSCWSDREIARQCNVSNTYVSNLRKKSTVNVDSSERTYTKNGSISTMNTAKIGISPKALETNDKPINNTYLQKNDSTKGKARRISLEFDAGEDAKPIPPPQIVKVDLDEICTAFISNIPEMSDDQISYVLDLINEKKPDPLADWFKDNFDVAK